MKSPGSEQTRFWQASDLGGVELLHARYREQRFVPMFTKGLSLPGSNPGSSAFVIVAPSTSSLLRVGALLNPDELDIGGKAHERGDAGGISAGVYASHR